MVLGFIAPISRVQHGLVTRSQLEHELSRRQIERLLDGGRLELILRGVYRVGGAPETYEQRVLAACLASGPAAYASFRCAAALWGLDGFASAPIEVTVPRVRRARIPGVTIHQSTILDVVRSERSIPVASVARTLCDLTAVVPAWRVERSVDEALRRGLMELGEIRAVFDDLEGRGRRRCTVMRDILEWREPGYHPGESAPEARIVKLLVQAGLPRPVQQHPVPLGNRTVRIDLAYPEQRIAIEYDGWEFHSTRGAFDHDRARANELELLGWTVLRFTSKSTDWTIEATVRAALRRSRVA